jgi:hypothetical protein
MRGTPYADTCFSRNCLRTCPRLGFFAPISGIECVNIVITIYYFELLLVKFVDYSALTCFCTL